MMKFKDKPEYQNLTLGELLKYKSRDTVYNILIPICENYGFRLER